MEDIVLNAEESIRFIEKMIHPDEEDLRRRDEFLSGLKDTTITHTDDEILVQAEGISLDV